MNRHLPRPTLTPTSSAASSSSSPSSNNTLVDYGFSTLGTTEVTCSEMDIALKAIEAYEGEESTTTAGAFDGCIENSCIPCVVRILPNGIFCLDEETAESVAVNALKYVATGIKK